MFSTARFLRGALEKNCLQIPICKVVEGETQDVTKLQFEWFENEDCEDVILRFQAKLSTLITECDLPLEEVVTRIHVEKLCATQETSESEVFFQIVVVLRRYGLREIRFRESCAEYFETSAGLAALAPLLVLDIAGCNLTKTPSGVLSLENLEVLLVRKNKLTTLPAQLGTLTKLKHLDASDNSISMLPDSLEQLKNLEELTLSNNRLKAPIVNLGNLQSLRVLHLDGNPLQYFPELSQAPNLNTASLGLIRISASSNFDDFQFEIFKTPSRVMLQGPTINDTFKLLLSRSSLQHPLIAGGLAQMSNEVELRATMLKAEGLLPQLVHAMLSENDVVATQSCRTLCQLVSEVDVASDLERADVVRAVQKLMGYNDENLQVAGLSVRLSINGRTI